jgi:hypothetical protein
MEHSVYEGRHLSDIALGIAFEEEVQREITPDSGIEASIEADLQCSTQLTYPSDEMLDMQADRQRASPAGKAVWAA